MIQHDLTQTAMAREIREIPLTTERLLADHDLVASVADRIRHANPRAVVISGRGSSGNAGTLLRYLFEARAGLLVSTSAPSVVTTYGQSIDMRNAVFIVISQSGRSPDLVAGARSARKNGALTIAIVNDLTSPLALACELTLPMGCWPGAFGRGYKICCAFNGDKRATCCIIASKTGIVSQLNTEDANAGGGLGSA